MKNIIKFFGLLSLIGFSFFYTDKVMDVVLEQDDIMIEINQVKEKYKVSPIDAIIEEKGMIPGINGKEINVDKSYSNMKSIGMFHENYLIYDTVKPNISMYDNYNKYIIQGNSNKHMISLIFILKDDNYLEDLYKVIDKKNIKINFFVDYQFLNDNTTLIKELKNANIYSYGIEGKYTFDALLFSNNLIERITKKEADFCLAPTENKETLEVCADNKMFTILPNLNIKDNLYKEVKNNLNSGNIILIEMTKNNINNLDITIEHIKAKGLEIGYLSDLINEELIES